MTKCMKLTHNNHVELLPSQLSTFITSLLEHQCCELSGAWYVCHPAACMSTRLLGTVQFSSALHRWSHCAQQSYLQCPTTIANYCYVGSLIDLCFNIPEDRHIMIRSDERLGPLRGKRRWRQVEDVAPDCIFFI